MIRIGTRGSPLALAQANWVAERIDDQTELVTITTSGDRGVAQADKSRWVSELEQALLEERIDLAVHSAKDVPAELAESLELVAIPARADARDAICGAVSVSELPPRARVGTSSLRRHAQLRALREDLEVVDVTGNVDTRLQKLSSGAFDALVLAVAGLERLGLADAIGGTLDELVPAAGQGALAIEARVGWQASQAVAEALEDRAAASCVHAERELTRRLGASCNSSVGAHASPLGDGTVELRAWVGRGDGSAWITDRMSAPPEGLGVAVAERMLAVGAGDLIG